MKFQNDQIHKFKFPEFDYLEETSKKQNKTIRSKDTL